jgi:hypothetical protein
MADHDLYALDRIEAAPPQQRGELGGPGRGPLLKTVIDRHGAAAQAEARRDEGGGAGQRHRVGAARAGDQHQLSRLVVS